MKTLLRALYLVYYCLVAAPLFVVATILLSTITVVGCALGGQRIFGYWPGVYWSRIALVLSLCPTRVVGREYIPKDHTPCVVMANHQGAFDIFMMYGLLPIPFRWVMKASLRKVPFMGKACQMAGFIFVDDKKKGSIQDTMDSARKVLSEGTSIFIFPEGSRTLTGEITRFKKGAFVIASELDVPILPVTIDGAFAILPRGHILPHPRKIILTIHPAFHMSDQGTPPAHIPASARHAQQVIASALPKGS